MASLNSLLTGALLLLAVAGCTTDNLITGSLPANGPTTVAFESVDGPPPEVFRSFVRKLDEAARARQIAVVSHGQPAHYRVRLYLAVEVAKRGTAVAWVWDVYDRDQRRALRIDGREKGARRTRDAWETADDATLDRIARSGMQQLSAFLAPDRRPQEPPAAPSAPSGDGRAVAQADTSGPDAAAGLVAGSLSAPRALAFAPPAQSTR
jgi:hypothetical protein